jgi:acetyl esterase/lipase
MQEKATVFLVFIQMIFHSCCVFPQKYSSGYFKVADIRYSEKSKISRLTSLDVYMPRKGSNSPVVVWVHGGVWAFGDKSDVESKPRFFTDRGYLFVSVNHRLSPEARFPEHAQDLADALFWIFRNIKYYSGDPTRIFLMGYASGGHLLAYMMLTQLFKSAGINEKHIKGIVLLDAMGLDIPAIMAQESNKARQWCMETFGNSMQDWIDASPVSYLKPGISAPPFLILYSGEKSMTEVQALSFSRKLSDTEIQFKVINYRRKNTLTLNKELGREDDKPSQDIIQFLHECLRN